jgi:flagellar hook-basal body complex protein FliE
MSSEIYQTIADVSAAADGYYEDMLDQLTQNIENVSTKQDLAREDLFDYVKTSDSSLLNAILDASKHAEDLDAATNTRIDTVEAEINQNIADTSADIHLAINDALATSSANL